MGRSRMFAPSCLVNNCSGKTFESIDKAFGNMGAVRNRTTLPSFFAEVNFTIRAVIPCNPFVKLVEICCIRSAFSIKSKTERNNSFVTCTKICGISKRNAKCPRTTLLESMSVRWERLHITCSSPFLPGIFRNRTTFRA